MAIDKKSEPLPSAKLLNKLCACQTFDRHVMEKQMDERLKNLFIQRPNLFSSTTVFISEIQYAKMAALITVCEKAINTPYYQQKALSTAPSIASFDPGPKGAFTAYDFHLSDEGPFLIEINTNAGGALINLVLGQAQEQCCNTNIHVGSTTNDLMEMFLNEWKLQHPNSTPELIAIVDDSPQEQSLYPEFLLFEKLFKDHGFKAAIADPVDLVFKDNALWYKDQKVSMVYNRLTDFYLQEPRHNHLKDAYVSGAVVLTPSPRNHALYANKANLEMLSDSQELAKMKLNATDQETLLSTIPRTRKINPQIAPSLWAERKDLFFKPNAGYGSRAAYRGDKITKKVWEEILKNEYVAQKIIPPSKRLVNVDGVDADLKVDLRVFSYLGKIQLLAARLYEGQTTNFRTLGGGFAPVAIL